MEEIPLGKAWRELKKVVAEEAGLERLMDLLLKTLTNLAELVNRAMIRVFGR